MPVNKEGRWVSYAELHRDGKPNIGGPVEAGETLDQEKFRARAPLQDRRAAAAAIAEATGAEVDLDSASTAGDEAGDVPGDLTDEPEGDEHDAPGHVHAGEGEKVLDPEKVEQAEDDSRGHSGTTVFRDAADQMAGREDPVGVPAGSPIGAIPPGAEGVADNASGLDANDKSPIPGVTDSGDVAAASAPAVKAPKSGTKSGTKARPRSGSRQKAK